MGNRSRAKGLVGEREVAALWESHGFAVRGLEAGGDHLCLAAPNGARRALTIHSEVKRQERLQLWAWLEQLEAEAPPGALAVLSFRRSRSPWYACVRLDALAEVLA
jgi:hypothetical protein